VLAFDVDDETIAEMGLPGAPEERQAKSELMEMSGRLCATTVKDRYGEPERESECEPIKIILEGDADSNKTNTTSNTRLRHTTQVGQAHTATGVLLDLGINKQPSEPKLTNTHSVNLHGLLPVLHRSDRWPAPVRPVGRAGQAGDCSNRTTNVPESLSDFSRPCNQNTPKHNLHGRKTLHKT
jgi:hypothetical protein